MRIGLDPLGSPRDLHPLHEPYGLGLRVGFVHSAVLAEHLGDLPTYRKDGVECGQRVLEDHRDLRAADPPPLFVAHGEDVLPAIAHLAAGDETGW